jgi:hypothetical protein
MEPGAAANPGLAGTTAAAPDQQLSRPAIAALQSRAALLYASRTLLLALFLGSSVVEQPAVNRLVAGSNPARGAKLYAVDAGHVGYVSSRRH